MPDTRPPLSPADLQAAVARRERDEEIVVLLNPGVAIDDRAFEAANQNVTVLRTNMIHGLRQVYVFHRDEMLRCGIASETTAGGLQLHRLPGTAP